MYAKVNMMQKNETKEIVYFQCEFPDEHSQWKGLPIALYLWKKFPASLGNEIYIKGIFDHYDDLRLLCIVFPGKRSLITSFAKYDELFLELTWYRESTENEFSLQIIPKSKWFYNKKSIKILAENINKILHSDDWFSGIKWFYIDEVGKTKGSENPTPLI